MWLIIPVLLPALAIVGILASSLWCITIGKPAERQLNKKKLLIFSVASFLIAGGISAGLYGFGCLKYWDKEVWHFKVLRIQHEEKWTTHETRTETYYTGSGKNRTSHTRTVHYTETHGPYWTAYDETGSKHSIPASKYDVWSRVWGNQQQTGIHKGSASGWNTAISGRIFECKWPNDLELIYPWDEIHHYKNKVRYSHSVLKLKEPTRGLLEIYPRPADKDNTDPVISYGPVFGATDVERMRRTNARLGPSYLVHTILVAFGPGTPRTVVDDVLSAWMGVNKNELVTFVALNGNKVEWCEVQSWMDDTTIHGSLRNEIMGQDFSLPRYSDLLLKYVPTQWKKKNFRDFDYLRIEIHWGWQLGSILLQLAMLLGTFVVINNKVEMNPWDSLRLQGL